MKFVLFIALFMAALGLCALDVSPYGPTVNSLYFGNFDTAPISFGGNHEGSEYLFIQEGDIWNSYAPWVQGLPVRGTCMLTEEIMMVAFGEGTYSDGVYNLDLGSHTWALNEWFFWPNFIRKCDANSSFYVGERDGLFQSSDGGSWSRITALGTAECNSFDSHGVHLIANSGNNVYYSINSGQSWQVASTGNLRSFRYTPSGILYAIMDVGSDSDGIWRSDDYGATWVAVYYTSNLSCIGPEYSGYLCLGWDAPNEMGNYVALLSPQHTMHQIEHASLHSPVKDMDVFPLVNTPSFYVVTSLGCYFVTGFLPDAGDDPVLPEIPAAKLELSPNPFCEGSKISYQNASGEGLRLNIYNVKGQLIRSLKSTGGCATHTIYWDGKKADGSRAGSGIYLIMLQDSSGRAQASAKAIILK